MTTSVSSFRCKSGGLEAKPEKETTQLTIHKVLVTAVQRAPVATPPAQPSADGATAPAEDTSLPTGSLLLTVAVNDVDASENRLRLGVH